MTTLSFTFHSDFPSFSLRFHIVNLDWRVHPQFTRLGTGFFSPLCDCVTTPFAVYSTKE